MRQLVENDLIKKVSYDQYREKVRRVYGGRQGAFLAAASLISLHSALGNRMLKSRQFDLSGAKSILDVGSGAGQIVGPMLRYADEDARITCCDLSPEMLRRAQVRLKSDRPHHVAADLAQLPFADGSFDVVTCGYVLEHVPDPRQGLSEMARVLIPGGRMMLLATEDSFSGMFTSRIWACQTYNRQDLKRICSELGLLWKKELWFSRMHRLFRAGGIGVELVKQ
jgi:ubiquinone/menaquinone biosynthesis C-methylase UbiE